MRQNKCFIFATLKKRVLICLFLIIAIAVILLEVIWVLPSEYNIKIGNEHTLNMKFPLFYSINSDYDHIVEISKLDRLLDNRFSISTNLQLKTINKGSAKLDFRIFGVIPYKSVRVNVVPRFSVVPSGKSIGINLNTDGVLIVGVSEVVDVDGEVHDLADEGNIRIGDLLMAINREDVRNSSHVAEIVQSSKGEELQLTLIREGKKFSTNLVPVESIRDNKYRLGFWIRDRSAGVGTLTFLHLESGKFGALGHAVTDVDTGSVLTVKNGEIVSSKIIDIKKSEKGSPGEIKGIFQRTQKPIGMLKINTNSGLFGKIEIETEKLVSYPQIEIAYQHEIQEGKAYILTTLDDNSIEKYDIKIEKINFQTKPDGKGMIIKITDERLLSKTGGIVQGMSGSPIIQNEKIVGAVTHVFVNDPAKGYAIFIEWMVSELANFDNF
ncbi:SpoIVB peptidase [Alkaliphilus sp. AH-315-G20]|nr:SpoIVB peptidase [Alkaliphilus sp. AH-315-G20]